MDDYRLSYQGPLAAHPGHDNVTLVIGTVEPIDTHTLKLKIFDRMRMLRKTIAIAVDEKTSGSWEERQARASASSRGRASRS